MSSKDPANEPVSVVLAADARAYVSGLTPTGKVAPGSGSEKPTDLAPRLAVECRGALRRPTGPPDPHGRHRAEAPGAIEAAVNEAIAVLAGNGVLRPLTLVRRNRAWEARELFDLVDHVEGEVAEPDGREPFGHA